MAAPLQGPQRSAGRTTARASGGQELGPLRLALSLSCAAFLGVLLLMVLWSWFIENVKELA